MKRERFFFVESVQKITGLLPFSRAPTLNGLHPDTHKQPEEKRQKKNAYKRLNMVIKKMRRNLRERKQKNALNMYDVTHTCSIALLCLPTARDHTLRSCF